MSQRLYNLAEGLKRIGAALDDIVDTFELADGEDLTMRVKNLTHNIAEARQRIDELVFEHSDDMIYWAELPLRNDYRFPARRSTLAVGPLVEEHLFHQNQKRHPDLGHPADHVAIIGRSQRIRLYPGTAARLGGGRTGGGFAL